VVDYLIKAPIDVLSTENSFYQHVYSYSVCLYFPFVAGTIHLFIDDGQHKRWSHELVIMRTVSEWRIVYTMHLSIAIHARSRARV